MPIASTFKIKTNGVNAVTDDKFSKQVTEGEKYLRDTLCRIVTQPMWYVWLLARWPLAGIAGLVFGPHAKQVTWRTLTLANLITSTRFCLFVWAVSLFADGAPLAEQTKILFWAIITDIFDGAAARNNNEITPLGIYMDHIGDWLVILWVLFLSVWHITVIPFPLLAIGFLVIPILLAINAVKFIAFCDPECPVAANIREFAIEELQTDFWGRIQFNALSIAVFGALFLAADLNPAFFLGELVGTPTREFQTTTIYSALGIYLVLGGKSIGDALDYSEVQARRFKERLRKLKAGSQ